MENQTQSDAPAPTHEPGQVIGPSQSAPPVSPSSPVPPEPAAPVPDERPAAVATPFQQPGLMVNGQMISYNEQQPSGPKKRLRLGKKVLIPAVALLVLLGGTAAAYFGYIVPNKPSNVLASAIKNSLSAHQVTISGLIDATSSGVSGRVDYKAKIDADNHAADITLNTTVSGVQFPIELLTAKGNLYVKIGDLSTIEGLINSFATGSSNIGQIKQIENQVNTKISNQWIEVDNTLIKEAKLGCLVNYPATLSQTDIASLENSYNQAMFATITNHSSDTVNGAKSVKYDVQIDDNKLAGMNIGDVGFVSGLNGCLKSISQSSSLNLSSLKDGKQHTVSIWVDSASKMINKFATSYKNASSGDETAISGTLNYGNVNIQAPVKSVQLVSLLSELGMGSLLNGTSGTSGGAQQQTKDAERQTDINAITTILEGAYTNNGYYPTLAQINSTQWVLANVQGLDGFSSATYKDPDGTTAQLSATPAANVYAYQPAPAGCNNTTTKCQHYTLTATLSTGKTYTKQSLN